MKLKSQTTTKKLLNRRLPINRPPTHPGEMLFEEFIKPLNFTIQEAAQHLGISYFHLNEIIKGHSRVTPETALRLSQVFGMSADFWLGLQQDWDIWHTINRPEAEEIFKLEPMKLNENQIA